MADLTEPQTLDMLGDLAAGELDDVFSQAELQRFYDRAGNDYNLAVYYGWRQIFAAATKWVDYQVAQTKVSRSQAAARIKDALELWANESRIASNQLQVLGMNGVPPHHKPLPADDCYPPRGRFYPSRGR